MWCSPARNRQLPFEVESLFSKALDTFIHKMTRGKSTLLSLKKTKTNMADQNIFQYKLKKVPFVPHRPWAPSQSRPPSYKRRTRLTRAGYKMQDTILQEQDTRIPLRKGAPLLLHVGGCFSALGPSRTGTFQIN